jgi:predicted nucleic acid-binding protein
MVVFDNSVFCLALHPDARPPAGVDRAKDRIEHLLDTLRERKEPVIIPAPVLAEFLVFAGADGPQYLTRIRETSVLRVEPFDERAAIELADMEIEARRIGNKRGPVPEDTDWQKVKFDRQIVAIAKACGASAIYSHDPHIKAHAKDSGIPVISIGELPTPPAQQMDLEGLSNVTQTEPQATGLSGSGSGPAQDQAGAEGGKAERKKEGG